MVTFCLSLAGTALAVQSQRTSMWLCSWMVITLHSPHFTSSNSRTSAETLISGIVTLALIQTHTCGPLMIYTGNKCMSLNSLKTSQFFALRKRKSKIQDIMVKLHSSPMLTIKKWHLQNHFYISRHIKIVTNYEAPNKSLNLHNKGEVHNHALRGDSGVTYVMQWGMGVKFLGKSVTKVYGSTLLAL